MDAIPILVRFVIIFIPFLDENYRRISIEFSESKIWSRPLEFFFLVIFLTWKKGKSIVGFREMEKLFANTLTEYLARETGIVPVVEIEKFRDT